MEKSTRDATQITAAAAQDVELAKKRKGELESDQTQLKDVIAKLRLDEARAGSAKTEAESQSVAAQQRIEGLRTTETELMKGIDRLREQLEEMSALAERVVSLKAEVTRLEASRDALNSDLQKLQNDVRDAESLRRDIERLKTEKLSLTEDKNRLTVELEGLQRRLDALKASIAAVESSEQAAIRLKSAYEALIKVLTELGSRGLGAGSGAPGAAGAGGVQ
jgi:chromosome segregation ATPase